MKPVDAKEAFERAKSGIDFLLKERDRLKRELAEVERSLRELGWRKPRKSPRKEMAGPAVGTKLAVVLEEIRQEPGSTVGDLVTATGFDSSHVAAACSALVKRGEIRRAGKKGRYSYFPDDEPDEPEPPKRLLG